MDPTNSLSEDFADLSVRDQNEPTVVSTERDRSTEDDHKSLDAELMTGFSLYRKFNQEPDWPTLLSSIALGDKQLVTLTRRDAEGLLTSQPSINRVLQKAWENGSFKEVRQLNVLWPVLRETPKRSHRPSNDVELTTKALQSAWRDIYFGNNHQLLFDNINAILPTQKPYSNQIAIVQSSGTGKSRMVHEQANLVFTIPFNLRETGENKDLAFPIPDDAVRDYLVKTSVSGDRHILKTNYLKFLGNVFRVVNVELDKCHNELTSKKITTVGGLAKWWSSHLQRVRTELYKAAVDGTSEDNKILPEIQKKHDKLLAKRRLKPEGSEDFDHSDYDMKTVVEYAAAEAARAELGKLISKLDSYDESQRIKLIIYFDEAHPLTKVVPDKDDEKTLYDFLCSCLNQFLTFPMFCISLSTNSSLAQFASPRALAKSARIRGGKAETHAPITETPFDCCEDLMVKMGDLKIKDTSTIQFMAKFGRPLFWTLLRGAGVKAPELYTEVLELARAKLVASSEINSSSSTFSRAAKLAVLDIQLSLDFEPRREKVQIEEANLVESHMRIAYSIPDHREYLRSGYPSEPLLAEAAAQQLATWRKQEPFSVVEVLTDIVETGLLDRGELGELTGRQLLLDAYHRAVEFEHDKKKPLNYSAGCRLVTFINELFTSKYAGMILNSTPDNVAGLPFKEVFKDALVCFTHFGKMADDTGVTSTAAWAAFVRHMAIICPNNQRSVDCILPVLLRDTRLCEHVMTGFFIQFKRRKTGGTVAKYSIDQAEFNFFPKTSGGCTHGSTTTPHRPYVSLIMELGLQPKIVEEATTPTIFKPLAESSKKPSGRRPRTPPSGGGPDPATPSKIYIPQYGQRHHDAKGHARYNIFAYGCSSSVYHGIDASQNHLYAHLLNSRDFLGEHPRKDGQTLKAVRRMKPFWNGGDDCYHWVEHNAILHGPVRPPGVEFGVGDHM